MGAKAAACREDGLASADILTQGANEISWLYRLAGDDGVGKSLGRVKSGLIGPLDGDDCVCACGKHGTGHDAGGLTWLERQLWGHTRGDVANDGEGLRCGSGIGGTHGVSVHPGIGERGKVESGRNVFGQNPAQGACEGDIFRGEAAESA